MATTKNLKKSKKVSVRKKSEKLKKAEESFVTRFESMKKNRQEYEEGWRDNRRQYQSALVVRRDGTFDPNFSIEANTIEQKVGEQGFDLDYRLEPVTDADVNIIEPLTRVVQKYEKDENIQKEYAQYRLEKSIYGTGHLFSGITRDTRKHYKNKKSDGDISDDLFDDDVEEVLETIWHIGIKNVNIWDIWVDPSVYSIEDADDCVRRTYVSEDAFEINFRKNKSFTITKDVKKVQVMEDGKPLDQYMYDVYEYFNKVTGEYQIFVNQDQCIFAGYITYAHGELPFSMAQEYPNPFSYYGYGTCKKLEAVKAYHKGILKNMFMKSNLSSGAALFTFGGQTTRDIEIYPGEVSKYDFTDNGKVEQFNFKGNIGEDQALMGLVEDLAVQQTGINPRSPYKNEGDTAFQAGLIEQGKKSRRAITEFYEALCFQRAMQMFVQNVMQYAPKLLAERITDAEGNTNDVKYAKISLKDREITKDGNIKVADGEYGMFELTDESIRGQVDVEITTKYTRSTLKELEKAMMTEYIQGIVSIANLDPNVLQKIDFEGILEKYNYVFGVDNDSTRANTNTRQAKADNGEKMGILQSILNNQEPGSESTTPEQIPA